MCQKENAAQPIGSLSISGSWKIGCDFSFVFPAPSCLPIPYCPSRLQIPSLAVWRHTISLPGFFFFLFFFPPRIFRETNDWNYSPCLCMLRNIIRITENLWPQLLVVLFCFLLFIRISLIVNHKNVSFSRCLCRAFCRELLSFSRLIWSHCNL